MCVFAVELHEFLIYFWILTPYLIYDLQIFPPFYFVDCFIIIIILFSPENILNFLLEREEGKEKGRERNIDGR